MTFEEEQWRPQAEDAAWAKLQEVKWKHPVRAVDEYAQFLRQECQFVLVDQLGPVHDPRFQVQMVLNGRPFPIAEGSSKKVSRKHAAAAALHVIQDLHFV